MHFITTYFWVILAIFGLISLAIGFVIRDYYDAGWWLFGAGSSAGLFSIVYHFRADVVTLKPLALISAGVTLIIWAIWGFWEFNQWIGERERNRFVGRVSGLTVLIIFFSGASSLAAILEPGGPMDIRLKIAVVVVSGLMLIIGIVMIPLDIYYFSRLEKKTKRKVKDVAN